MPASGALAVIGHHSLSFPFGSNRCSAVTALALKFVCVRSQAWRQYRLVFKADGTSTLDFEIIGNGNSISMASILFETLNAHNDSMEGC